MPVFLEHTIPSLAALEALWREELSHHRLTLQSKKALPFGKRVVIRLAMPGPQLELGGTVCDVRPEADGFAIEVHVALSDPQRDTLQKLADI